VQVDQVRLSAQRQDGIVVIAVAGELDVVTSSQFADYLAQVGSEQDSVIIDLSDVDFLDTSALAVIIGHWKRLSVRGGTLALAGARYQFTRTLWITGLADRLPMFTTAAEAVHALRPAAVIGEQQGHANPSDR
jgi:anti-sigma B factor antagonist